MADLNAVIETKQAEVNKNLKIVEAARAVNNKEDDRNRNLMKQHAAYEAKLNFIEKNYDYSTVAKKMDKDYFEKLIQTNQGVNDSMNKFTEKLYTI